MTLETIMHNNTPIELAKYIDHTLLAPDANSKQIERLCFEAKEYGLYSVCVAPYWVHFCHQQLESSDVEVCTVIGFPLGNVMTETKELETNLAKKNGATEFDMVMNISALKSGDNEIVVNDISKVVRAASPYKVKVILETCLLTQTEIVTACQLAEKAGAHFVKTSTGFSKSGATLEVVELMLKTVGPKVQVKASGGIRDRETALEYIRLGVKRIGTSSGLEILKEFSSSSTNKDNY